MLGFWEEDGWTALQFLSMYHGCTPCPRIYLYKENCCVDSHCIVDRIWHNKTALQSPMCFVSVINMRR